MKKKIMYAVACVALAAVAGWNYQQSKQNVELSDLALENVEALASGELASGTCYGTGAGFTDQYCPGGYTICCWAHTNVFGKN